MDHDFDPEPPESGVEGGASADTVSRRQFLKLTGTALPASAALADGLIGESTEQAAAVAGPGPVPITLQVNERARRLTVEPRVTLLDALRDQLGLTGAKKVCDRGTCGACTVLLDGAAVYGCSVLAVEAQGRAITTIEGLAPEGSLHPVSAAFVDHDAQQCGFCTPGFVVATKALLDRHPNPTGEQISSGLSGNLCRCGTYVGIRLAAIDAAKRMGQRGGRSNG
jgi:xanthine dehydrogenase YagT iron-sulfur-binding subunit